MFLRATGGSLQMPVVFSGTEIMSYHTYAEAQTAVDFLPDEEFDVESITIVDTDLHLVERVTGRLTMVKATLSGASSGALWDALMGLMTSFTSTNQSAFLWVLSGIAGGALAGTFMSGLLYAMMGGRRDFTSQLQVVTSRYAVLTLVGIDRASELLQRSPGNQMRPRPARRRPESRGPSEYGSRPDEKSCFGVRLSDEGEDGGAEAPRDSEHAAPAQESAEIVVEPAEGFRKPSG